jgi:hypothetical protein
MMRTVTDDDALTNAERRSIIGLARAARRLEGMRVVEEARWWSWQKWRQAAYIISTKVDGLNVGRTRASRISVVRFDVTDPRDSVAGYMLDQLREIARRSPGMHVHESRRESGVGSFVWARTWRHAAEALEAVAVAMAIKGGYERAVTDAEEQEPA